MNLQLHLMGGKLPIVLFLVMCQLGLEATGHAQLGLAQAMYLAWTAPGLGLEFCKPEAMA